MSDLISRADAIEEISKGVWNVHELIDRIKALPSADAVSLEFYKDAVKANIGLVIKNKNLKEQIESADAVPQLKQTDTLIIADALRYLAKDTERHELDRTRAEELREQILQYGASMCSSADAEQVTSKLKSVEISTDKGDESTMSQPNGKLDLISRDDVLKYPIRLDHYDEENGSREFVYGVESVIEYVESLPSAEPIERISDNTIVVKYADYEDIGRIILTNGDIFCKMFYEDAKQNDDSDYDSLVPDEYKTEPSDRLENQPCLVERNYTTEGGGGEIYHPTRQQGEWIWRTDIPIGDGRTSAGYICSNCGKDYWHGNVFNFCPNCGAIMKGGAE